MRNVHEAAEGFQQDAAAPTGPPPPAAAKLPSSDAVEATMLDAATEVPAAISLSANGPTTSQGPSAAQQVILHGVHFFVPSAHPCSCTQSQMLNTVQLAACHATISLSANGPTTGPWTSAA